MSLVVSVNTAAYDVHSAALAAGWNGTTRLKLTITNNAILYGATTGTYGCSIDRSLFPAGSIINFINNNYIIGKGGKGGPAPQPGSGVTYARGGGGGGSALYISPTGTGVVVNITNNGTIAGGGYGGTSGVSTGPASYGGAGGGGAGYGDGGNGGDDYYNFQPNSVGQAGTYNSGGVPGIGGSTGGAPGTNGAYGSELGNGAATLGAANATWIVAGIRIGAIN